MTSSWSAPASSWLWGSQYSRHAILQGLLYPSYHFQMPRWLNLLKDFGEKARIKSAVPCVFRAPKVVVGVWNMQRMIRLSLQIPKHTHKSKIGPQTAEWRLVENGQKFNTSDAINWLTLRSWHAQGTSRNFCRDFWLCFEILSIFGIGIFPFLSIFTHLPFQVIRVIKVFGNVSIYNTTYLMENKVAALLDYAPYAGFWTSAKYFKLYYTGAFNL